MNYLTADVPMPIWHQINGCTDNSMAVDIQSDEGDVIETVSIGSCVQDAGWRAAALHTGSKDESGWPPDDDSLTITLQRTHWEWVLKQLHRWESIDPSEPGQFDASAFVRSTIDSPPPG